MAELSQSFDGDRLNSALGELGLSSSECELYLASLSAGPLRVADLADRLGLERPYVYSLIRSLREKGLAPPQNAGSYQKQFVVHPPSVVLQLLRKKRIELDVLTASIAADMPKYLASYRQGSAKTQVLFYEGREKFIELYERILAEEANETLYFGEVEHFFGLLNRERVDAWIRERIAKKVNIRTLMPNTSSAHTIPTDPSIYRETRVIPKQLTINIPASFEIFGKNLIFWQPHTPVAVVVQDEYITNLHREIFNLLWTQGINVSQEVGDI
jgi:sugar-specific transcriptional regulator TrmB